MLIAEYIKDAIDAAVACNIAREGYDGGSWGYHGHAVIMAEQKAAERLEEALTKLIVDTIRDVIGSRGDNA